VAPEFLFGERIRRNSVVRQSQKKCVRRRSLNAAEKCVAAFEQVRLLLRQKEYLMQKTTKKAAADYMTEPHDPRDSISSQASVRSPSSRATNQPPPPGRRKPVMESKNSPFFPGVFIKCEIKLGGALAPEGVCSTTFS